jgi:hypothetical protein
METEVKQNILERVVEAVKEILSPQQDSAFTVQKDLNGKWRWVAAFSNNFKDRDGEIISEKAWDDYIERANSGLIPLPELWVGHIQGTKHGQADMIFGAGNFVVAVGHFDDTDLGRAALKYYQKNAAKTPLSHGFTFPSWGLKQGIYGVVNPFEITTLPPPLIPSNPFTEFEVENMKQISPEQKAALALVFGQEKAETIVSNREQQSEDIKAAGVAFKDFAEVPAETPADEAATVEVEAVKPMADVLVELMEAQGELLSVLTAQGKAIKAMQESVATKDAALATEKAASAAKLVDLEAQVNKLSAELALTPVRASEAAATEVTKEHADSITATLVADEEEFKNRYGVPMKRNGVS